MSKTDKNSCPCGAYILLRQRKREREREMMNSIVLINKISANEGKNLGRKKMMRVREFEIVNREAREGLTVRLLLPLGIS